MSVPSLPARFRTRTWTRSFAVPAAAAWLALTGACRSERELPAPAPAPLPTPDRLQHDEKLPESETAFGLPVPEGMRLSRHFRDSAYFTGKVPMDRLIDHVKTFVEAGEVEMMSQRMVFKRARIKGAERSRIVRVEISETPRSSQIYIRDITPEHAAQVATEAERWRRAGRNPDGTPIDQNRIY